MAITKLKALQRWTTHLLSPCSIFLISLLLPIQQLTILADLAISYLSILLALGIVFLLGEAKPSAITHSIQQCQPRIAEFSRKHRDFLSLVSIAILLVCHLGIYKFTLHFSLFFNLYCSNQHLILLIVVWIARLNYNFVTDYILLYRHIVAHYRSSQQQ